MTGKDQLYRRAALWKTRLIENMVSAGSETRSKPF